MRTTAKKRRSTRRLAIILVLALLISLTTAVQAAEETQTEDNTVIGIVAITADSYTLRENVNESAAKDATTAYKGDIAYVLSKGESEWYYVNYNMCKGYIHEDAVKAVPCFTKSLGQWEVTEESNLYETADAGKKAKDVVYEGEKYEVTGYRKGWLLITGNNKNGYIKQENLYPCEKPKDNHGVTVMDEESLALSDGEIIVTYAMKYLGYPYVWGGTTITGFDCSGLVWRVFTDNGYKISRTADYQYNDGVHIKKEDLQPGDIIFFERTYEITGITHCGIYIGDGKFIHAASTQSGIRIDRLSTMFYSSRYVGACRIKRQ